MYAYSILTKVIFCTSIIIIKLLLLLKWELISNICLCPIMTIAIFCTSIVQAFMLICKNCQNIGQICKLMLIQSEMSSNILRFHDFLLSLFGNRSSVQLKSQIHYSCAHFFVHLQLKFKMKLSNIYHFQLRQTNTVFLKMQILQQTFLKFNYFIFELFFKMKYIFVENSFETRY